MLNRRVFTAALGAAAVAAIADTPPSDDDVIRDILKTRIDQRKLTVGMAACVVTPDRQRIITWGHERLGSARPICADTVFEIASITKVFTALLLAEMAQRGEVGLDDPVASHLPGDFHVPELDGRRITLADLATHTSGLPWWPPFPGEPPDFDVGFIAAAIPKFTLEQFKTWLAGFRLQSQPGTAWAYGNTGYGLLSMALAHRGGQAYDALLQTRVLKPLGLKDTAFRPTATMTSRLTQSYLPNLQPAPPIDLGIFAAAGGLHSTPRDLARFATALLPGSGSHMAAAAELVLRVRRPAPQISGSQALGWEVRDAPGGPYISKDGVAWGQAASIVYDPDKRLASVVFSNTTPDLRFAKYSGGGVGAADLAEHILRPDIPLDGKTGATY